MVGKFGEFEDFLVVQMRSVCWYSWQFSKLWISRGLKVVVVLVGEVWRLVVEIWWERKTRKYFVLSNLMMVLVICGGGYKVNLKFEFVVGV